MIQGVQDEAENTTDLEAAVVNGMARILDIPVSMIDVNQSFVSQGLHSLAAIILCSDCRKQGFMISMEEILTAPSINSLIQAFDSTTQMSIGETSPSDAASEVPLTRLQKMLMYDSIYQKTANIVQHVATYRTEDMPRIKSAWRCVVAAEPIFRLELDMDTQSQRVVEEAQFRWKERYIESMDEVQQGSNEAAAATGFGTCFTVLHYRGPSPAYHWSVLIFSIHHALIDGFSASLILNKVAAASKGIAFDPSPPFTIAAERVRKHAAQTAEEADAFWRQQDKIFSEASGELLLQKPAADRPDRQGEYCVQTGLDAATLTKFSQAGRATVATFHYAAWALVLSSYSNATTVVFGAVLSARTLGFQGAESMIGPLIATQPMRIAIDLDAPCGELVQQTYDAVRSLLRFQTSERKGAPLTFSSALAMQYDSPALESAAVKTIRPAVVVESSALPLNVLVEGDGRVRFVYHRNSFSDEHVRQMAAMYRNVLHTLTYPTLSVQQCLMQRLDADVSRWLLTQGNHTSSLSRARPGPTVTSLIEQASQANSACIAVRKGAVKLTYSELMVRAARVATVIEHLVKPGQVVCVVADRSINWIVGVCAILKAGAVYCPLDSSHAPEYRAELLRSSGAALLLCTESTQLVDAPTLIRTGFVTLAIDSILADDTPHDSHVLTRLPHASDPAFLCFTSGSTGKPKGVACVHGAITAFHATPEVRLHSAPGVRIAQFLSPGFDGCVHEVFASLCYGATLVLRTELDDPFSHLCHADVAMMTPSVAAGLDPTEYPNLQFVYFAGEPVQQSTLDKWAVNRSLYNLYGPTEGTIGACQQKLHVGVPVNVGPPVPSTRLYILDDNMHLTPPGVTGNIFIAGVQVSRGYINPELAEQNAREFLPDPFCSSLEGEERMYRTGDLGFWDTAGNVHVCGRKDRQIKMRGFRVNLDDVGAIAMREMTDVRKALATEHKGMLVLWVEPECVDTQELARRLRAVLPHYALPKNIVTRAHLPLSRNGKLDAKALVLEDTVLEMPCASGSRDEGLTNFEALIAKEWRQLLGLDASIKLTPKDNFTALGGHSVLQLNLAARLRSVCRMPLAIRDIIQAPTLAAMATGIQARMRSWNAQSKSETLVRPLGTHALSLAELEWWYRYSNSESQCAFNVPWAAALQPGVDLQRLAYSLEKAMGRHRILRSRFVPTADGGVTRVIADEPIQVQMVEAIDINEFINRPFNLTHDALVRVALSPSTLTVSISHIICDLTALHTLLADVATLYNGSTLSTVKREYFDSTAWSQPLEHETAFFWSTNMQGLQIWRGQDDKTWTKSYRGTSLFVTLPEELYQGIITLTTTGGLTLHQFGLAATAAILHSLCGCNDIMLGSPYMNRNSVEDQDVIGLYLQALPVRVKVQDTWTSLEVLRAVQCASQTSLSYPILWPRLLQHLGLPFPSHRQQLFDSVVTFHDDRITNSSVFPVVGARPLHVWTEGSKFGLLFEWHMFAHHLSVRFEYDTDRVPETLIRIIQNMLLHAVELLLDPACRYDRLLQKLGALLRQQCTALGADVDEMRSLAEQHLAGVLA
ncbi:acetyl-CoA synthetase-like protein [Lizonia empirigonia]|nr:acetyl-CoA synthetase-like protein [Lizonia empirigonia]